MPESWFAVRLEFRAPAPLRAGEAWDLDNLAKCTIDGLDGVFGLRQWRDKSQPADDRVVRLESSKRTVRDGEQTGARVTVWIVPDPDAERGRC
jgi:hypothetical protein